MKRALTGIVAAFALAASQAAAGAHGPLMMSDRAGAESETTNEMFGAPLPVLLLALAIIVTFVLVSNDDDSSSP